MRNPLLVALLLLFMVVGCGKTKRETGSTVKRSGEPDAVYVAPDDAEMNAAIEKARASIQTFIEALQRPQPTQTDFAVKMSFTDGKYTEHIWISEVSFDGTNFNGIVNNEPDRVKGVKIGEHVSVDPKQISDWRYLDNQKLVGGFTFR